MSSSCNVILNSLGFWIGCNGFQIYAVDSRFQNLRSRIFFSGIVSADGKRGKTKREEGPPDRSR